MMATEHGMQIMNPTRGQKMLAADGPYKPRSGRREGLFCGTRNAESCERVILRKIQCGFFLRNEG